jgi:hypothetical protein
LRGDFEAFVTDSCQGRGGDGRRPQRRRTSASATAGTTNVFSNRVSSLLTPQEVSGIVVVNGPRHRF